MPMLVLVAMSAGFCVNQNCVMSMAHAGSRETHIKDGKGIFESRESILVVCGNGGHMAAESILDAIAD